MRKNRFTDAAEKAAKLTNKQLASELAMIGSLSQKELNRLLPLKRDKLAFVALMKEVESDTAMDIKLAYLQQNIQSAGKVALTLLKGLF